MLQNSKDEKVRTTRVKIETGQKWSARKNTNEAESHFKYREIVGRMAVRKQGLN